MKLHRFQNLHVKHAYQHLTSMLNEAAPGESPLQIAARHGHTEIQIIVIHVISASPSFLWRVYAPFLLYYVALALRCKTHHTHSHMHNSRNSRLHKTRNNRAAIYFRIALWLLCGNNNWLYCKTMCKSASKSRRMIEQWTATDRHFGWRYLIQL